MTLPRFLARLLAALIVTIAGWLLASAAEAHAGHAHGPALAAEAGSGAQPDLAVTRRPDAPEPRLASADRGPACHGVCCSLGASCCAPSLGPPRSRDSGRSAPAAVWPRPPRRSAPACRPKRLRDHPGRASEAASLPPPTGRAAETSTHPSPSGATRLPIAACAGATSRAIRVVPACPPETSA